jgi:multicomponent Na+:H+ antiporter subunit G
VIDAISVILIAVGAFFFLAGSAGVLRFPDVYTRLHALTKADNLGLGFVVIGLSLRADSWVLLLKMLLIWSLVIVAGATASHLVAEAARLSDVTPWRRRP